MNTQYMSLYDSIVHTYIHGMIAFKTNYSNIVRSLSMMTNDCDYDVNVVPVRSTSNKYNLVNDGGLGSDIWHTPKYELSSLFVKCLCCLPLVDSATSAPELSLHY